MLRFAGTIAALTVVATTATATAEQWADKMFKERTIDFGAVPRAAKIEHEFLVTNPYNEPIHIASVRSSCGCTQPRVLTETIKPGETGKILAAFNTHAFTGQRGATVTVTIDQPRRAEVQLQVRGYIRTDVVLSPNYVNFGSVSEGATGERKIAINYAGRGDWQITGVKSHSPYVTADVKEVKREGGRIAYELDVKLADNAPKGYLNDQLTLLTNDRRATTFPVKVEGRIVPELAVSPAALLLGSVQPGEEVTKQLVVRASEPFKILDIRCSEQGISCQPSDQAKAVHLLPVKFTVPNKPGKVECKIEIITDRDGQQSTTVPLTCEIGAPLAGT